MAVKLEGSIRRYIGLASDTKPMPGSAVYSDDGTFTVVSEADVPPGSSYLESDTGRVFRWNGLAWLAPPLDDSLMQVLATVGDELVKIRRVLEEANELDANDLIS